MAESKTPPGLCRRSMTNPVGGAGRAGRDFVTSPEVGQLFGALVARALDGWWRDAGAPDPFLVIEAGAGRGRLSSRSQGA